MEENMHDKPKLIILDKTILVEGLTNPEIYLNF